MDTGGAERVAATLANAWASRGDQVALVPTFSDGGECFYQLSPHARLVYLADLVSSRARTIFNQIVRLKTCAGGHGCHEFVLLEKDSHSP